MSVAPQSKALGGLILFPFKVYMFLGPISLIIFRGATADMRFRGVLAEATGRVVLGCAVCVIVFVLAAAACFVSGRRCVVAENLIFAGVAFIVYFL
jgi:hypothetical protein